MRCTSTRWLTLLMLFPACGYYEQVGRHVFKGGISSTGNKPHDDDEPEASGQDGKDQSGQVPPATGGTPDVSPAAFDCGQGETPALAGLRFRMEPGAANAVDATLCSEGNGSGILECAESLVFAPASADPAELNVAVSYVTGATRPTLVNHVYRACGDIVAVAIPRGNGLSEVHEFRVEDEARHLVHLASGRRFERAD